MNNKNGTECELNQEIKVNESMKSRKNSKSFRSHLWMPTPFFFSY